jgi:programmed cell death protein 5
MENELERIRAERKRNIQEQLQHQQMKQQLEIAKKTVLFKFMTKGARERLGSVRAVRPGVAEQIEIGLIQAVQMGQIKGQITEEMLKSMLAELSPKKDFRIRR